MVKKKKSGEENAEKEPGSSKVLGVDGKWGWFIVFNSFICNMIVDGVQYTFSNFLVPITESFGVTVAVASLIGALLSGFYNFSGPIAGAIGNKFGFRMVIITGSIVSSGGLMISYFAPNAEFLYFFYGILGGLGFGMIYMASVIMTSLYFEKYRALAASLSVCGTGVGTFVFAPMGTWLVETWGWRTALIVEGVLVLICILCGLSFKPLEFVSVVPVSREPSLLSNISIGSVRRGSVYYPTDTKKTLPNEAYPTFKEALHDTQERRNSPSSVQTRDSLGNIRRPRIYSVLGTHEPNEFLPVTQEKKCTRWCRICCFNFWHCRCKYKELTLGDRPLYRDDIFYGGSLTSLRAYSAAEPVNYHLSVTRIPDAQEIEEHATRKCCVCHKAFLRTFITMMGLHLFQSKVFCFLCVSSFLYTMSLFMPYVFIRTGPCEGINGREATSLTNWRGSVFHQDSLSDCDQPEALGTCYVSTLEFGPGELADQYSIPETHSVWLVSSIGISNTIGRLLSGVIKSFTKVNAAIFAMSCLFFSGVAAFIFLIKVNLASLMVFACVFGLFTAPFISLRPVIIVEFLGLERLTNAFGLVLLSQGVASIIGPPLAGVLEEETKHGAYVIYLSGSLMMGSAMALMLAYIFGRRMK